GVDGTCRVTDFGVAGAAGAQGEAARGKPSYVAPERLLGKLADQRADLFSLGVVLYVSLTGVDPFLGATADETVRKVLEGPILPPSEVGLRPPPSLDWVCMKALARNPEERFQSAEEMATQLRRVAARDEALSLAGPGPVASWVRTVLKPTLEARRAAAIKGVEVLGERGSLFTIPPGAVTEGDVLRSMSEPPPSSQDFGDRTEVLSAPAVEPRGRAVIYAAVALAVVAVGWVMLFPDQTKHLLKMDSAPAHMTPEEAHELTREAPVIEEPAPEESVEPVHVPTIRPRGGHDE
ncbi:MAG TPA: protein kinase, partial [Polyangiaceae bacterium]|nr:protein kinase [Polyangiaceae bacterium]